MPKFSQKIKPKDRAVQKRQEPTGPVFDNEQPIAFYRDMLESGEPVAVTRFGSRGLLSDIRITSDAVDEDAYLVIILRGDNVEEQQRYSLEPEMVVPDILLAGEDKLLVELVPVVRDGSEVRVYRFWLSGTYSY